MRAFDTHPPLVYGPVESRRLGRSLGVNLLPVGRKLCDFDCAYCQCGRTYARRRAASDAPFPTVTEVEIALRAALVLHPDVADICFAGDGEPTAHPRFRDTVLAARRLRGELAPSASISVLTNGVRLGKPSVRAGLLLCDRRIVKLDAGVEDLWRRLDRPPRGLRLDRVVRQAAGLPRVETQTLLCHGPTDNATPVALDALAEALRRIRPIEAQVMTVTRRPPDAAVRPLSAAELRVAGARLRGAVPGLCVRVYA